MTIKELYQMWAPAGCPWVDWVRPVAFVALKEQPKMYNISDLTIPVVDDIDKAHGDTAIIVDLPGAESVAMGLALAKLGYRPVPIYNGTIEQPGARATVDNQSVGVALLTGGPLLQQITIPVDAPPAFLVDSNRMNRFKMEKGLFDNSWDVYPQDIPSADYLRDKGIGQIIVIGRTFSKDLQKVLYSYQKKKLGIWWTRGYEAPQKVTIPRSGQKEKE